MEPRFMIIEWAGTYGGTEDTLLVPLTLLRKAGLQEDYPYTLNIGCQTKQIFIKYYSPKVPADRRVWCSDGIFRQFNIPAGTILTGRFEPAMNIKLGPLIGLLTVKFNQTENPFGKQSKHLRVICERAKKAGVFVFAFTPEDICTNKQVIHGYIPEEAPDDASNQSVLLPEDKIVQREDSGLDGNNAPGEEPPEKWIRLPLPYPDLVYNRIPSRFWETQELFVDTLAYLKNLPNMPLFNPEFLDKCQTHEMLSTFPLVVRYLPQSRLYQGPEDIELLTQRFDQIFLKPCSGSLGRRIIRVHKNEDGFTHKYRNREGEIIEGHSATAEEMVHNLRFVMGKRPYLVQQAIPLALYQGQEFDVRLLLQKDRFGQWRRTKTYVRIVQPGSLTSNLSSGATAKSVVEVLREVFDEEYLHSGGIGEQIRIAAERIAQAVENCFPGIWGELGIDLGVDINGRVWLIEVNSKPFRAINSSVGITQRIERSFLRPLEFAKFLTGFYRHSI